MMRLAIIIAATLLYFAIGHYRPSVDVKASPICKPVIYTRTDFIYKDRKTNWCERT